MIITEKCIIRNKVMIFSQLTRVEEALAILLENEHDAEWCILKAIDDLKNMVFEMEIELSTYMDSEPLFDELRNL